MHGFCTDFARFQNVQKVLFAAKSDKGCRNYWVKNHVVLIKNNDGSNQNKERIQQFVERIHPDVIITDMIRTAMYLDAFAGSSARKIFDLDDILSTRYKRQLNSDSKMRSAVTGAYAQKLPAVLNRWLSRPFLQDQILKFEIKRLAK